MNAEVTNLSEKRDETPWQRLTSLACSLVIVLGGMFWTYHVWLDTNQKYHELFHVRETIQGLHLALDTAKPEAHQR